LVFELKNIYYLNVKLPYKVLKDSQGAKYDSKKKVLKVRLNVDKSQFEDSLSTRSQELPSDLNQDEDFYVEALEKARKLKN
jgi:hypothetical protein